MRFEVTDWIFSALSVVGYLYFTIWNPSLILAGFYAASCAYYIVAALIGWTPVNDGVS